VLSRSRLLPVIALCPALLLTIIAAAPQQSEVVIVKQSTGEYHRATCADVNDGKGVLAMTRAQAEARGFKAHGACVNAPPPSSEVESKPPKPAAVYVFTDAGKYYHRAGCAKLGPSPKRVLLDDAGKKLWPCPVCRPPIRKKTDEEPLGTRRR
jgi:hypothetical protein